MKVWTDAKGVVLLPESELEHGVVEAEQASANWPFEFGMQFLIVQKFGISFRHKMSLKSLFKDGRSECRTI